MHLCFVREFHEAIPFLTLRGALASIHTKDSNGLTPLDEARKRYVDLNDVGLARECETSSIAPPWVCLVTLLYPAAEYAQCSFAEHGKRLINQPFYECVTCKLVDGDGCCDVCASRCHKGHNVRPVTGSKLRSAFCDCGARGRSSEGQGGCCQALDPVEGSLLSADCCLCWILLIRYAASMSQRTTRMAPFLR